ncbi:hypothetical protein Y032_0909g2996 [Ancylostoma ceylanicum]|uniref:Uncharacterized protein n=1 Tax=Ancylostoma ceylanicum TaxID=53326 RepID=A0A016W8X5_9BILA|nr:hypothetical protein Y032_0909g2996 [Ancylostoma ceylanicum]
MTERKCATMQKKSDRLEAELEMTRKQLQYARSDALSRRRHGPCSKSTKLSQKFNPDVVMRPFSDTFISRLCWYAEGGNYAKWRTKLPKTKGIKYISIALYPLWLLALWRFLAQMATSPRGRAAKRPQ